MTWWSLMELTVNFLWPCDDIWQHKTLSSLVQIMACHLFSAKPLPEQMMTHELDFRYQYSLKCDSQDKGLIQQNVFEHICKLHYNDVIMSMMTSQIRSVSIVYWTICSGADQRKHQSSVSLAFVRGIHRWRGKCFHFMASSCQPICSCLNVLKPNVSWEAHSLRLYADTLGQQPHYMTWNIYINCWGHCYHDDENPCKPLLHHYMC